MIILVLMLLIVGIYWLYWLAKAQRMDRMTSSLPGPPALPLLGNGMLFIGDTQSIAVNNKGCAKIWLGPKLYVAIGHPEDAQVVLENCLDKDVVYRFLRPWLGHGLFVAPVGLWKTHRKVLLPVFHNKIVEKYLGVIADQSDVLLERLREQTDKAEFDVLRYVTACTLDIVFETAMGERMDIQHSPETPYLRARHTVMEILNMRLFKVWLQPDCLFNLTRYAKQQKDNIDLTHKFTDEIEFTDEQLREHIDSITIAGNDTTALVIAYTLEDLLQMHYLERVIKESMRLYTVVPIIARNIERDTHLRKFLVLSQCCLPAKLNTDNGCLAVVRTYKLQADDIGPLKIEMLLFPIRGHQIKVALR
ncbi:Uncharacterized protein OBRU01_12024 [Operophtera brumata]|uniref:Cytochrome P450 n=1 Tax=Operophtera brumata TaxID=104452 RepID=A0A0L7LBJ7_OPEBR|nr:Uncharacterized protein OBRU01_12024 [Operophtera brumata]